MIPGQDITIVTTLSDDGAQFPSLHNGFFSLEGYVTGQATISCSRLTAKRFRLSASNRLRRAAARYAADEVRLAGSRPEPDRVEPSA